MDVDDFAEAARLIQYNRPSHEESRAHAELVWSRSLLNEPVAREGYLRWAALLRRLMVDEGLTYATDAERDLVWGAWAAVGAVMVRCLSGACPGNESHMRRHTLEAAQFVSMVLLLALEGEPPLPHGFNEKKEEG